MAFNSKRVPVVGNLLPGNFVQDDGDGDDKCLDLEFYVSKNEINDSNSPELVYKRRIIYAIRGLIITIIRFYRKIIGDFISVAAVISA